MRHEETQLYHHRVQPFQFYMCSDSKVGIYQLIDQPFTKSEGGRVSYFTMGLGYNTLIYGNHDLCIDIHRLEASVLM